MRLITNIRDELFYRIEVERHKNKTVKKIILTYEEFCEFKKECYLDVYHYPSTDKFEITFYGIPVEVEYK